MSIGRSNPANVAKYFLVHMIEENGGVMPSLADVKAALGRFGDIDIPAVLDAAILEYKEKASLMNREGNEGFVRKVNAAMGTSYEPGAFPELSFKKAVVRESLLIRVVRSIRQWAYDLSVKTRPVKESGI
jgi:hypothetical protein